MEVHKNTTALNRFSIVLALLALNFLAIFFLPEKPMSKLIRISNIEFFFSLGQTLPLFIAIISLFGSYWILTAHSFASIKNRAIRQLIPNIVLPSITVLIFGLMLMETSKGLSWWAIMAVGLVSYSVIIYSEYKVLNPDLSSNTIFSILLISLAHALFMALVIALRGSVSRIFLLIPAIILSAAFVSYRTIIFRSDGKLKSYWVIIAILITTQFAVALYYLFLSPSQYGLILTCILFLSNALITRIGKGDKSRHFFEPLVMSLFIVLIMFLSKWI
jgi:hypothetical protein